MGLKAVGVKTIKPPKSRCLPGGSLEEINASMSYPLRHRLKRPRMRSFPHIDGLFLLSRVTGIVVVKTDGKKRAIRVDRATLGSWKRLNPTERYFTLLEAWLLRGGPEVVGELEAVEHRSPVGPAFVGPLEMLGVEVHALRPL